MRLILFDIDGTLLWTDGAGRRAIHRALERTGAPGVVPGYRLDGKTDPQIVRELLAVGGHPEAESGPLVQEICRSYVSFLAEELARPGYTTRIMPGVFDVLDALEAYEARGEALVGLLTGNVADGAALKLRAAGIDPARFAVGAFGADGHHRPDLPPVARDRASTHTGRTVAGEDLVIIGDTPADVACGRPIGARAVAVATGSYTVEALRATGADHVFGDLADTEAVLTALFA
jgi:phosphoglycolate phosphatase